MTVPVTTFTSGDLVSKQVVRTPHDDMCLPGWDHGLAVGASIFLTITVRGVFAYEPFTARPYFFSGSAVR